MKKPIYLNFQLIKFTWILLLISGFGGAAFGATFTVTKIADTNDNVCDVDCSLREAIALANVTASDDVINFDADLFAEAQTIILGGTQLEISNNGSLTINGTGANKLTISGNNSSRVFLIKNGANATLNGVSIIRGSVFVVEGGAGILIMGGNNALTINYSTVSNNTTNQFGYFGGGISNHPGGILKINNSTISNNRSSYGSAVSNRSGSVTITNSTLNSNSGFQGGGIYNTLGTISVSSTTISNNSAGSSGGGIYHDGIVGTISLLNTIVADNTSDNAPDINGRINSLGYNLIENIFGLTNTGTNTGNILGQDPQLSPLANNGGTTQTQALLIGSPAIEAGNNALAIDPSNGNAPLAFDQRGAGFPRIVDGNNDGTATVDIGAFEFQPTPNPHACTPTTTVTEGDLFPGGIPSFGVSSGSGTVTVDHVNAGTGLQSLTVVGVPINAVVNIQPFMPGTFNPLVIAFTAINPALPVDFTLRAASTFHAANIRVRCGLVTPTPNPTPTPIPSPTPGSATTFSGRATSINATINGVNAILNDTGDLPATGGFITRSLTSGNLFGGALTTGLLEAVTQGASDQSQSRSRVENLNLMVGGNTITGNIVGTNSLCTCNPGGPSCGGGVIISNLRINGVLFVQGTNVTFPLVGGGYVIINEQILTGSGNSGGFTANGVHVIIPSLFPGTPAVADIILASAHSDIVCAIH